MDAENRSTSVVAGYVVDRRTNGGPAGLRVEAWDMPGGSRELVDCSVTDDDGRFEMALGETYLAELFPDGAVPVLSFRVFEGERLLANTGDSVTWRVNGEPAQVRILLDTVNPPPDGADPASLVVRGLVAGAVEGPLAGITVQAFDRVLQSGKLRDIRIGLARTDARGRYRIEYVPAAGKVKADLTVRALDEVGREISSSAL